MSAITLRRDDAFRLHERTDWHPDPVVRNSAGGLRPPLPIPCDIFLQHHAGAGRWDDTGDFLTELEGVENWAANVADPPKPNEYNSAVAPTEKLGAVYAGPFQAAHCAGWNDDSVWGNLALWNGVLEDPADPLLYNIIQMRHRCVERGWLKPLHTVMPHRAAPCGQATGTTCPMDLAETPYWEIISAPLDFSPPPPPPDPDVWDPENGRYGNWPARNIDEVHVGDHSDAVRYFKAVLHFQVPPFCAWYGTISLNKAAHATKPRWIAFHNRRAAEMFACRDLCTDLKPDNVYGTSMADAVDAMKIAYQGRWLEGARLDFAGGGNVIGNEVERFLDAVSDGLW